MSLRCHSSVIDFSGYWISEQQSPPSSLHLLSDSKLLGTFEASLIIFSATLARDAPYAHAPTIFRSIIFCIIWWWYSSEHHPFSIFQHAVINHVSKKLHTGTPQLFPSWKTCKRSFYPVYGSQKTYESPGTPTEGRSLFCSESWSSPVSQAMCVPCHRGSFMVNRIRPPMSTAERFRWSPFEDLG